MRLSRWVPLDQHLTKGCIGPTCKSETVEPRTNLDLDLDLGVSLGRRLQPCGFYSCDNRYIFGLDLDSGPRIAPGRGGVRVLVVSD